MADEENLPEGLEVFTPEPGARGLGNATYFLGGLPLVKPVKDYDIQPPIEEWGWEPPRKSAAEELASSTRHVLEETSP